MKVEKGKIGAFFMQSASAYVANTCIVEALDAVKSSGLYKQRVKQLTDRAAEEYRKSDIEVAQLLGAMFKDADFGPHVNLTFGEGLEHHGGRLIAAVVKECAGDPLSNVWARLVLAETLSEISIYLSGPGTKWESRRKCLQGKMQAIIDATRCPKSLFKDLTVQSIGGQIAGQFLSEEWVVQIINKATREYLEQKNQ